MAINPLTLYLNFTEQKFIKKNSFYSSLLFVTFMI